MSIENPLGCLSPDKGNTENETNQDRKKRGSKIGNWAIKTAALAGAVGVGYFGSMDKVQGQNLENLAIGKHKNKTEQGNKNVGKRVLFDGPLYSIEGTGEFENIKTGNGDVERQELFTIIDKQTGESRQFLSASEEDATNEQVKEFLFPIHPEWFPNIKKAVETERAFQQSGLTDPKDSYKGSIEVGEVPADEDKSGK